MRANDGAPAGGAARGAEDDNRMGGGVEGEYSTEAAEAAPDELPPVEAYDGEESETGAGNALPDPGNVEPFPTDYDPDAIEVVGDQQAHVPDDVYRARFARHEQRHTARGIPRLALRFEIVEGAHVGTVLTAWRNTRDTGQRSRVGAGANSKIATELRRVAQQRDKRMANTRLTVAVLRDVDLAIQTRTTGKTGWPYSVVDTVLGLWDATAHPPSSSPHCVGVSASAGEGDADGDGDGDATGHPHRTPATGYRIPDTGYRMPVDGDRTPDPGVPDGKPLPADLTLPDDWIDEAAFDGLDNVERSAARFVQWYAANGRAMANWRSAWRLWYARDIEDQPATEHWE